MKAFVENTDMCLVCCGGEMVIMPRRFFGGER